MARVHVSSLPYPPLFSLLLIQKTFICLVNMPLVAWPGAPQGLLPGHCTRTRDTCALNKALLQSLQNLVECRGIAVTPSSEEAHPRRQSSQIAQNLINLEPH